MFHVVAVSPKGERITLGLGQRILEHALDDRDSLRHAYLRKGAGWQVLVEDSAGVLMDWSDAETSPTSGGEAA